MSGDQRVTQAREFLAGARNHKVAELPPSVLMREDAELRRLLGQLLDLVTDYEDAEIDDEVTQVTVYGGAYISPADAPTLNDALADAIAQREPPGYCADCQLAAGLWCRQHEADMEKIGAYRQLAANLGIEVPR